MNLMVSITVSLLSLVIVVLVVVYMLDAAFFIPSTVSAQAPLILPSCHGFQG